MLKFLVCGETKPPTRNEGHDVGYDLYVPNLTKEFVDELIKRNPGFPVKWNLIPGPPLEEGDESGELMILLAPQQDLLIPSYVKASMPSNMYIRMANKSGVAVNQKLVCGAEVVDPSYQGDILMHVINTANSIKYIRFGQKLLQMIPTYFDNTPAEVYYEEKEGTDKLSAKNAKTLSEFFTNESPRGEGALGSTGLT